MKSILISGGIMLAAGAAWVSHLPSPSPINGAFLVMCAAGGAMLRSLWQAEQQS